MSWTTITKPATGNATKKSFADSVVDDLTYLYGQLASTTGDKASIVNGSFEIDGDADGVPDGWTKSDFTGGVLSITGNGLADTNCYSGARAIKYVHPGGASNGGGTITSTDFEVVPSKTYAFSWVTFSTAAGLVNITYVEWFTAAKTLISTTTLETLSANNPSAWSQQGSVAVPPSTARFAKLKFSLGDSSGSTGGTVYLDAVSVSVIELSRSVEFEGAGSPATTYTWTCPTGVSLVLVEAWGGGGSGGASGSTGSGFTFCGGGGGSGEYVRSWVQVVPGTDYTISAGGSEDDTTFASTTVVAKAGTSGSTGASGAAGAGGTGGTGQVKLSGNAGIAGTAGLSGRGGDSIAGNCGGKSIATGSGNGLTPTGTKIRGAGGSGAANAGGGGGTSGGAGGPGSLIIRY